MAAAGLLLAGLAGCGRITLNGEPAGTGTNLSPNDPAMRVSAKLRDGAMAAGDRDDLEQLISSAEKIAGDADIAAERDMAADTDNWQQIAADLQQMLRDEKAAVGTQQAPAK